MFTYRAGGCEKGNSRDAHCTAHRRIESLELVTFSSSTASSCVEMAGGMPLYAVARNDTLSCTEDVRFCRYRFPLPI